MADQKNVNHDLPSGAHVMKGKTTVHPINYGLPFKTKTDNPFAKKNSTKKTRVGEIKTKETRIRQSSQYMGGKPVINKSLRVYGSSDSYTLDFACNEKRVVDAVAAAFRGYTCREMTCFRSPSFVLRPRSNGKVDHRYRVYSLGGANELLWHIACQISRINGLSPSQKTRWIMEASKAVWNNLNFFGFQLTDIPDNITANAYKYGETGVDDEFDDNEPTTTKLVEDSVYTFEVGYRVQSHAVWLRDWQHTSRLSTGTRLYFVFRRAQDGPSYKQHWAIEPLATTKPISRSSHCMGVFRSREETAHTSPEKRRMTSSSLGVGLIKTKELGPGTTDVETDDDSDKKGPGKMWYGDIIMVGKVVDSELPSCVSSNAVSNVGIANGTKRKRDGKRCRSVAKRARHYRGTGRVHLSAFSEF